MSMQNSLYYLIPTCFLLLLIFPIVVEVRASYNPIFNKGVVALFVFRWKIIYFVVTFHGKFIELENEKMTKRQEIEFESQKFAALEEFGRQIKDKINLRKMSVFYNIGTGSAASGALVCGALNFVLDTIFLFIKHQKPTASLCIYDTTSFNKTCCEIALITSLSISLFDVVYSFLYSVILTKKRRQKR